MQKLNNWSLYREQASVESSATKEISTSLLPQDSGTIEEEVAERSREPGLRRAGAKLSSGYAKIAVFMSFFACKSLAQGQANQHSSMWEVDPEEQETVDDFGGVRISFFEIV